MEEIDLISRIDCRLKSSNGCCRPCTWLCKKVCARLREKFSPATASPGRPCQAGASQKSHFFMHNAVHGGPDAHDRHCIVPKDKVDSADVYFCAFGGKCALHLAHLQLTPPPPLPRSPWLSCSCPCINLSYGLLFPCSTADGRTIK